MAKYFFDCEFIEGFHKPLFGKRRHFIDLISIGIECDDGRSLHLISNEYNYNDADQWVKDNVLMPLYKDTVHGDMRNTYGVDNFQKLYGVSNKNIATFIALFVNSEPVAVTDLGGGSVELTKDAVNNLFRGFLEPEFYAYYADYDWVVFCSLFGRMIDLPAGFPMYCRDLKQMLDEKQNSRQNLFNQIHDKEYGLPQHANSNLINPLDLKEHPNYPKQENEHSALDDAKWNFELYKFLIKL